jgi:hypothetical protein
MFASRIVKEVTVPNSGQFTATGSDVVVVCRRLSWKELEAAGREGTKGAFERMNDVGGVKAVKELRDLIESARTSDALQKVVRAQRAGSYDRALLLQKGVASWTATVELTAEALADLDTATADLLAEAIVDLSDPPQEQEKNDSTASTGS